MLNVGESGSAPPGSTTIALLVSGNGAVSECALRYVEKLPQAACLRLWGPLDVKRSLRAAARQHKVAAIRCEDPADALLGAHIVVVFGNCPMTRDELVALANRGVPVLIDREQHHG